MRNATLASVLAIHSIQARSARLNGCAGLYGDRVGEHRDAGRQARGAQPASSAASSADRRAASYQALRAQEAGDVLDHALVIPVLGVDHVGRAVERRNARASRARAA